MPRFLILIIQPDVFDWLKKKIILYNLCCLRHKKAYVKNVSIRTALYLFFVYFKVILNVNSFYLLHVIAEN